MSDKQKEVENFAYQFGEHCLKFSTHVHYDKFVQELIQDLSEHLNINQLTELQNYVDRLAQQRIKEEKSGGPEYFIVRKGSKGSSDEDSSDSDREADIYADFM